MKHNPTRWACLVIILVSSMGTKGVALFSRADGNWSNINTWSYTPGGVSCNCTPIASDDVTIDHVVNMDKHLTNVGSSLNGITGVLRINTTGSLLGGSTFDLDIRSTGVLYLCGTLTARDVTFSNGSNVYVCPGASLTVNGDFFNKNSSNNIVIDGSLTVNGSYENGNGAVISGSGTIVITNGPITNTGNTYGCVGTLPCPTFPCTVTQPCGMSLPVELLSFKGHYENPVVQLSWVTATEINNNYFAIESSIDGIHFNELGQVIGAGNSSMENYYQLTDKKPYAGINYYRLRQVDYDGRFELFGPIAIKISSRSSFTIFPNLIGNSGGGFYADIPGGSSGSLEIIDQTGKVVMVTSINRSLHGDNSTIPFVQISGVANGVYSVFFTSGTDRYVSRLIITR